MILAASTIQDILSIGTSHGKPPRQRDDHQSPRRYLVVYSFSTGEQLPSRIRRVMEAFPRRLINLALDPAQDLLLCIGTCNPHDRYVVGLQLRACSPKKGTPHPYAGLPPDVS